MAYKEPGAYSRFREEFPAVSSSAPAQIPLIVGSGATSIIRSEVITRGAGDFDVLPNIGWENVLNIGYSKGSEDFIQDTDYTFVKVGNKINWNTSAEGAKMPRTGESYVVTGLCSVSDAQYELYIVDATSYQNVYGGDFDANGNINKISVGIKAALLSGTKYVCSLQVKPNSQNKVTGVEYAAALEKYATDVPEIWRIAPVDVGDDINTAIDAHVKVMSTYEERMERTAIYGKITNSQTATEVISSIGGYAQSKKNTRIMVPYPTKAIMTLSDGLDYEVDAGIICAAYAGLEGSLPGHTSKTRQTLDIFKEIIGVKMKRTEKNLLAEQGVMILEQVNGPETPCVIRHQLTTDMSTKATQEASIVAIRDHVAKALRNGCENYIGKYNITADTINKVKGTAEGIIADLISTDWILPNSKVENLAQSTTDADTLLMQVKVAVPYPCNFIEITISI